MTDDETEVRFWECKRSVHEDEGRCVFHTHPDDRPPECTDDHMAQLFLKTIRNESLDEEVLPPDSNPDRWQISDNNGEVADSRSRRRKQFIGAKFCKFNIENEGMFSIDRYQIDLRATHVADLDMTESLIGQTFRMEASPISQKAAFSGALVNADAYFDYSIDFY